MKGMLRCQGCYSRLGQWRGRPPRSCASSRSSGSASLAACPMLPSVAWRCLPQQPQHKKRVRRLERARSRSGSARATLPGAWLLKRAPCSCLLLRRLPHLQAQVIPLCLHAPRAMLLDNKYIIM